MATPSKTTKATTPINKPITEMSKSEIEDYLRSIKVEGLAPLMSLWVQQGAFMQVVKDKLKEKGHNVSFNQFNAPITKADRTLAITKLSEDKCTPQTRAELAAALDMMDKKNPKVPSAKFTALVRDMREEGLIIIDDSSRTHTITMPGDPKTAFAKAMERLEELSRECDQQKAIWEAEIEEKTAKTTASE